MNLDDLRELRRILDAHEEEPGIIPVHPTAWRVLWREAARQPMHKVLAMLQGHDWPTWRIVLQAWQGKP